MSLPESGLHSIQLGPFEIHAPIGHGGTAEVWRGVHRQAGFPVGVKLATARDPAHAVRGFELEARVMSQLDHPGIIRVYDYGRVTREAVMQSRGRLTVDGPYVVMELAQDTLRRWTSRVAPAFAWSELRGVILELLGALGHAHARGIVHRDIKPSNVLLAAAAPGAAGAARVRLSDFGLALTPPVPEASAPQTAAGTIFYMAPEQVSHRWRDFGPWTDLYALGCLVFELATGRRAFSGVGKQGILEAHLRGRHAEFCPAFPVPGALEGWLGCLLERDPTWRYRSAAQARAELLTLGPADPVRAPGAHLTHAFAQLDHDADGRRDLEDTTRSHSDVEIEPDLDDPHDAAPPPAAERPIPGLPLSWRTENLARDAGPCPPWGVRLARYRLLQLPIVGREAVRDRLWEALRAVASTRAAAAVVLSGPPGIGTSRVAEWLCERVSEVGGGEVLRAEHALPPGPSGGLHAMLARWFGTRALADHGAVARVRQELTRIGLAGGPSPARLARLTREPRPEEPRDGAYEAILAAVGRLGAFSPVVVWLDDLHLSPDSLGFARFVMTSAPSRPLPLLLVATAAHGRERELLEALPGARHEPLAPLERPEIVALLTGGLCLTPALADGIAEAAGGNPLLAVQHAARVLAEPSLLETPHGFDLPARPTAYAPDLDHLWAERVSGALAGLEALEAARAREALRRAAGLGVEVDEARWTSACADAGIDVPPDLLARCAEAALIACPGAGLHVGMPSFRFVHPSLGSFCAR